MRYTVVGVWDGDTPVVVGVIEGEHQVQGGDQSWFEGGLWATSVDAADVEDAEMEATDEMEGTLGNDDKDDVVRAPKPLKEIR